MNGKSIHIPYVELPVSRIVFGCANAPMIRGEDVSELLDAVFSFGITTFDTAENYGKSEISLGKWIRKKNNRDRITVISKGCHPYGRDRVTPEDIKHDIENSFRQIGTEFIDIYFLHRDDLKVPVGPLVETLNDYHAAGKIGAFGGSNWTVERIREANAYAKEHGLIPFTVSSPNYGIAAQIGDPWGGGAGCVTLSGPENKPARDFYRRENIPVFAWSSLGRGMFSGKVKSSDPEGAKAFLDEGAVKGYLYPENFKRLARVEEIAKEKDASVAQIALAFILNQDFPVFPIVSSQNSERIKDNLKALDIVLTKNDCDWMDLVTDVRS